MIQTDGSGYGHSETIEHAPSFDSLTTFKMHLCNKYPKICHLFSDRIVEALYEWNKMCDKPHTWDPRWTPLQDKYGNWLQFLGLFPRDWARELNRLLIHGVDLQFVTKPETREDFEQNVYKDEAALWATISSINKDLHMKKLRHRILDGPFSKIGDLKILCNIMNIWKEASKKWQPVYDASRKGEFGSLGPNSFVPKAWRGVNLIETAVIKNLCRCFNFASIKDLTCAFAHCCLTERDNQTKFAGVQVLDWFFEYKNLYYGAGMAPEEFMFLTQSVCHIARTLRPDLFDCCIEGKKACIEVYIDDFILLHDDEKTAWEAYFYFEHLLATLGCHVTDKPGRNQSPRSKVVFLGIEVDFLNKTISVPIDKATKYAEKMDEILSQEKISHDTLDSLIGKLGWLSCFAHGTRTKLHSFYALRWHEDAKKLRKKLLKDKASQFFKDFVFWRKILDSRVLWTICDDPTKIVVINSDASEEFIGGINSVNDNYISAKIPDHLVGEPICVLEMEAALQTINSCGKSSSTHFIGIVDNTNIISAVNTCRSKNTNMLKSVRELWDNKTGNKFSFCYKQTDRNIIPDHLSRGRIYDAKACAKIVKHVLKDK